MRARSKLHLVSHHWDERARVDPFHYIASWKREWSPEEFFASGEADYEKYIQPVLDRFGISPGELVAADVGCGVGRVTLAIARRFATVYGIDVSPEMLRAAAEYGRQARNVRWVRSSGVELAELDSGSVDFMFSYLVLQHVPDREAALGLVGEMMRILRPGGVFLFQFNSCKSPTMNLRGRALWKLIDWLRDRGAASLGDRLGKVVARSVGLDPLASGSTWRGAVLDPRAVLEVVWRDGGAVAGVRGWGTQMSWCDGRKLDHPGHG